MVCCSFKVIGGPACFPSDLDDTTAVGRRVSLAEDLAAAADMSQPISSHTGFKVQSGTSNTCVVHRQIHISFGILHTPLQLVEQKSPSKLARNELSRAAS